VDLSDGSGRDGLGVDVGEGRRWPELFVQRTFDLFPRHGRGSVRQRAQLVGVLRREQVTPGRQELTELDKGDAAFLQCQT